jgi:SAM-dependent methyltransferase
VEETPAVAAASPYDRVCYHGTAVANTSPAHLALCSRWHGGPRPPLEGFRLLELGCGDGANLLPLAFYHPRSTFIGVDSSQGELDRAAAAARSLGLENIQLVHADVRDLHLSDRGSCDFVVAHGLYSWVPDDARDAILALCRRCLEPSGLAYVSYNAQPGWGTRRLVRETLLGVPAVRDATLEDRARRAREMAARLLEDLPSRDYAHAVLLAGELERVRDGKPFYVLHEYLAEVNDGFWLGEFVERAAGHGLHYVADAQFCRWEGHVPAELRAALSARGLNRVEHEQTADLLGNRYFRASILCRGDAPRTEADPAALFGEVHVATALSAQSEPFDLREGVVERFAGSDGPEVTLDGGLTKAAVVLLAAQWPSGMQLDALYARAARLFDTHGLEVPDGARAELPGYLTTLFEAGQVDLRLREPPYDATLPDRPRAHALARWEAKEHEVLTTPYHLPIPFDPDAMALVRALDGSRSSAELRWEFGDELMEGTLAILARWGLLER